MKENRQHIIIPSGDGPTLCVLNEASAPGHKAWVITDAKKVIRIGILHEGDFFIVIESCCELFEQINMWKVLCRFGVCYMWETTHAEVLT